MIAPPSSMLKFLPLLALASGAPAVTLYPSYNQAQNVLVSEGTSVGGTVVYLGTFAGDAGTAECETACLAYASDDDAAARCNYFVHFPTTTTALKTAATTTTRSAGRSAGDGWRDDGDDGGDAAYAGQCHAVLSPGWNPSYDTTAVTGAVTWPCRTDDDCSLNGACDADAGACACRAAWTGARCEQLNLLPATRGAGYRGVDDGRNTTSWGGAVLPGPDGLYHTWAAEMTEHCGIGAWA